MAIGCDCILRERNSGKGDTHRGLTQEVTVEGLFPSCWEQNVSEFTVLWS